MGGAEGRGGESGGEGGSDGGRGRGGGDGGGGEGASNASDVTAGGVTAVRPVTPNCVPSEPRSLASVFRFAAAVVAAASLARMTVACTLMLPAVTLRRIFPASAPRSPARLERKAACADASKVSTVPSKVKVLIMTG